MKLNLHLNATHMNSATESRTGRSVETVLEYKIFDHIDIAAVEDKDSNYKKDKVSIISFRRDYDVEKAGLFIKSYGTLKWCIAVYKKLSSKKYEIINCHSIPDKSTIIWKLFVEYANLCPNNISRTDSKRKSWNISRVFLENVHTPIIPT